MKRPNKWDSSAIGRIHGKLTITGIGLNGLISCDCSCGTQGVCVDKRNLSKIKGGTQSCGCYQKEQTSEANKDTVGLSPSRALVTAYRRKAETRGLSFELTKEQCHQLFISNCNYCGRPPHRDRYKNHYANTFLYNGIDRVDNKVGYLLENVVTCCYDCNRAKGTLTYKEFIDHCTRVCLHEKEKK